MSRLAYRSLLMLAVSAALSGPAGAQEFPAQEFPLAFGPFSPSLPSNRSNIAPLAFGMEPQDVAQALGTPLYYIKGQPGDETLLAIRNLHGSGLFFHKDRLYLQFRRGRLTGWKGDWGHSWMW
jgi:hypothetical protein